MIYASAGQASSAWVIADDTCEPDANWLLLSLLKLVGLKAASGGVF